MPPCKLHTSCHLTSFSVTLPSPQVLMITLTHLFNNHHVTACINIVAMLYVAMMEKQIEIGNSSNLAQIQQRRQIRLQISL